MPYSTGYAVQHRNETNSGFLVNARGAAGRGGSLAPKILRAAYTPLGLGDSSGAVADTKALAKPL